MEAATWCLDASKIEELKKVFMERAENAARRQAEEDANKSKLPRRTKVVRVKQEYIDYLLANPPKPYRGMSQELIGMAQPPKLREDLRALMARVSASHQKRYDQQLDFLEQYRLKGYAEEEIEIRDDEDTIAVTGN
ncbi:hypothetical protein PR202_ga14723 [Eleusine coracana subsp. coracana]|uniref:Uncharacterized protein n=1 Tax=Eleusine coracana subsp. coracana TaxID=191504 RepID=A0AAV5CIA0_ELECO|nr:hypothetical protein PR202_ga14723 [Eleusine coracana subsp. coracana]